MFNRKIFRANDIRGVYPTEINEAVVFQIAQWLGKRFAEGSVAVGRDTRLSSPVLYAALKRGLQTNSKIELIEAGLATTPTIYYMVHAQKLAGGVMITASHNPKEFNGLKIVDASGQLISGELVYRGIIADGKKSPTTSPINNDEKQLKTYAQFLRGQLRLRRPLRVVVDGSNGTGARLFRATTSGVKNLKVSYINDTPNGAFPGHGPDPSSPEASNQLAKKIIATKADIGVMFDNDADRLVVVDETGRRLTGTETLIFIGEQFSGPVVINALIGPLAERYFKKMRRKVAVAKVGVFFIKEAIERHHASFGGEYSGHYFFRDVGSTDCAVLAAIYCLNRLATFDNSLSDWRKKLPEYHQAVINIPGTRRDFMRWRGKLRAEFSDNADRISLLDGVRVEFARHWFSVRPSNNEDLIRLTVEAETPQMLMRTMKTIHKFLSSYKLTQEQ